MTRVFLPLIFLVVLSDITFAQEYDNASVSVESTESASDDDKPLRNYLKINLANLALRNYSLQYELAFSKRFSIAIGYRFMPQGGIPLLSNIESMVTIDDPDVLDALRRTQVKNTAITPELRLYVGKKGYGRGFYLAPFYRYAVYETAELPVKVDNNKKTVNLSGKLTTNTYGLQLGAQWALSKHISLDWWIIGPQFGTHESEFTGSQAVNFTTSEEKDIDDFFNSFSLPNLNLKSDVTNNSIKVSTSGPWAGIRAGLCLGIRL